MKTDSSGLPRLLAARELAESTGVSRVRLYELCRLGLIPHVRIGRSVRFEKEKIRAWLDAGGTRDDA